MSPTFDAIVVGSGITGGWAAKELTEKGLKVLMVERGRMVEHQVDYKTENLAPWELPFRGFGDTKLIESDYRIQSLGRSFDEWTQNLFVNDRENPYQTTATAPFQWKRGYQLGGRSLIWGRHCYRWGDIDFGANARDGVGVDWPIRYADLSKWYDHVESFIGVNGSIENLAQLPDGIFQPAMALNAVEQGFKKKVEASFGDRKIIIGRTANLTAEKPGRSVCQNRNVCARGCSYGAYFSTQSSTLPAAMETGNLTVLTDSVVERVNYDPATKRATGVRVIDTKTGTGATYDARVVFLCASTINSVAVLLRSVSEQFPDGLANSSGTLGRYLMDHAQAVSALAEIPGFDDHTYFGNRPNSMIVPRFRNIGDARSERRDMLRGYSFQGGAYRLGWSRGRLEAGIGRDYKHALRGPGGWIMLLVAFAECLPRAENRITLDPHARDAQGLAQIRIEFAHGDNERKLLRDAQAEAQAMIKLVDGKLLTSSSEPGFGGSSVHEMGGARMGNDPKSSVLNRFSQTHDVPNLFVTDGAGMCSTASQNPSLTYMALTARACDTAVSMLKSGAI